MQHSTIITMAELDPKVKIQQELEQLRSERAKLEAQLAAEKKAQEPQLTEDDIAEALVGITPLSRPGAHDSVWLIAIRPGTLKPSAVAAYFRSFYKMPLWSVLIRYSEETSHGSDTRISGGPGRKNSPDRPAQPKADQDHDAGVPVRAEG